MLQQKRASECHCCLMVKYLSQLHEQFTSLVPLVQFNWYCERGGDNDYALTLGRDLINLLFSQRCLQTFFIFLSRAVASLADVFEKNEKKNKTTSVYRLSRFYDNQALTDIFSNVELFHPRGHVQVCCRNL